MKGRRVDLSDDAESDVDAAVAWYEERSFGLGGVFLREVKSSLARIAENAELYAKVRGEVRRAAVNRFPYSAYYHINGNVVEVFAVIHDRRDPINWQNRI